MYKNPTTEVFGSVGILPRKLTLEFHRKQILFKQTRYIKKVTNNVNYWIFPGGDWFPKIWKSIRNEKCRTEQHIYNIWIHL